MVTWYIKCKDINEVVKGQTLLLDNLWGLSHHFKAQTFAEPAIGDMVCIEAENADLFCCHLTWISPYVISGDLGDLESIEYYECKFLPSLTKGE